MKLDFSQFLDVFKLSREHLAAIALFALVLILLPNEFLEKLGLLQVVDALRPYLSILAIGVISLLFCSFASEIITVLGYTPWGLRKVYLWKKRLRDLTPKEKQILSAYLAEDTRTQNLHINDGIVRGLEREKILIRVSGLSIEHTAFPYNIQPWVWNFLRKNPHLLDP